MFSRQSVSPCRQGEFCCTRRLRPVPITVPSAKEEGEAAMESAPGRSALARSGSATTTPAAPARESARTSPDERCSDGDASLAQAELALEDGVLDVLEIERARSRRGRGLDNLGGSEHRER